MSNEMTFMKRMQMLVTMQRLETPEDEQSNKEIGS